VFDPHEPTVGVQQLAQVEARRELLPLRLVRQPRLRILTHVVPCRRRRFFLLPTTALLDRWLLAPCCRLLRRWGAHPGQTLSDLG